MKRKLEFERSRGREGGVEGKEGKDRAEERNIGEEKKTEMEEERGDRKVGQ